MANSGAFAEFLQTYTSENHSVNSSGNCFVLLGYCCFSNAKNNSYFLLLPGDSEWSFKRSVSRTSTTDVKEIKDIDDEKDDETGKIINKERSETGRVRLFIYGEFNLSGSRVTRLPELS